MKNKFLFALLLILVFSAFVKADNAVFKAGNMGIGTNNPLTDLDVKGSSGIHIRGTSGSPTGGKISFFGDGSGWKLNIQARDDSGNLIGNPIASFLDNEKVGIGTTNPLTKLHIKGNAGILSLEGTDQLYINFYPRGVASGRKAYIGFGGAASPNLAVVNEFSGGNLLLIAGQNGKVGISSSLPASSTNLCLLNQGGYSYFASCSSSERYKYGIGKLSSGLETIEKLEPKSFRWKSTGEKDIGLIAEDVYKIEPRLVTFNEQGQVEGVKYDQLNVILVNAIKEQQKEIEELRKEIDELKKKV